MKTIVMRERDFVAVLLNSPGRGLGSKQQMIDCAVINGATVTTERDPDTGEEVTTFAVPDVLTLSLGGA